MESSLPFILQLRCVCEVVLDIIPARAYVASLKAYYNQSETKRKRDRSTRPTSDGWDQAVQLVERAQATFCKAEDQRQKDDIGSADSAVDEALYHPLPCLSTEALPAEYTSRPIMTDWDDVEIGYIWTHLNPPFTVTTMTDDNSSHPSRISSKLTPLFIAM
jgi:hypothetical protein